MLDRVFIAEGGALADPWTSDSIARLLKAADPDSALRSLEHAPRASWPYLAAASLFSNPCPTSSRTRPSFNVDEALTSVCEPQNSPSTTTGRCGSWMQMREGDGRRRSAERDNVDARRRVAVVQSLHFEGPIEADRITPSATNCLRYFSRQALWPMTQRPSSTSARAIGTLSGLLSRPPRTSPPSWTGPCCLVCPRLFSLTPSPRKRWDTSSSLTPPSTFRAGRRRERWRPRGFARFATAPHTKLPLSRRPPHRQGRHL